MIDGNENMVEIRDNVEINGSGEQTIFIQGNNNHIIIESSCRISNTSFFIAGSNNKITISNILDLAGKRLNQADDIVIGKHCWLGLRCMLLKGTEIPDYTVVAGGTICTKKFTEPNTIIAGVPAKVVKRDINWDRERFSVNVK